MLVIFICIVGNLICCTVGNLIYCIVSNLICCIVSNLIYCIVSNLIYCTVGNLIYCIVSNLIYCIVSNVIYCILADKDVDAEFDTLYKRAPAHHLTSSASDQPLKDSVSKDSVSKDSVSKATGDTKTDSANDALKSTNDGQKKPQFSRQNPFVGDAEETVSNNPPAYDEIDIVACSLCPKGQQCTCASSQNDAMPLGASAVDVFSTSPTRGAANDAGMSKSPTSCSEPKLQRINDSTRDDEVWDYTGAEASKANATNTSVNSSPSKGATPKSRLSSNIKSDPLSAEADEEEVFFKEVKEEAVNAKSVGE